jgi:hypothetical protein
VLDAGTYWLEWRAITGSTSTRAFGVPVHVDGATAAPGSNAMQSSTLAATGVTTWTQVIDTGVGQVQDLPFVVNGSLATAVPEPATSALWLLGCGALVAARRRQHRGGQPDPQTRHAVPGAHA